MENTDRKVTSKKLELAKKITEDVQAMLLGEENFHMYAVDEAGTLIITQLVWEDGNVMIDLSLLRAEETIGQFQIPLLTEAQNILFSVLYLMKVAQLNVQKEGAKWCA